MLTVAAVFAKLPDSATSVDVDVSGEGVLVSGVEVSRGEALAPVAGAGQAVIAGSAWPEVDLAAAAAVTDTAPFVTDLIRNSEDMDAARRVQQSQTKTDIAVSADVLFAPDQSALSSAAAAQLAKVAEQLKQAQGSVTVTGYTDSDNTEAYNLALSQRRAASVVAALKRLSPGVTFTAVGQGEADPVASNSTDEGKAQNRRVTVSFATKAAG